MVLAEVDQIEEHGKEDASQRIADRDESDIGREVEGRNLGPAEHAYGQEIEVGNAVFEAQRDERADWEGDGDHLALDTARRDAQPYRQTYQHVAQHAAEEGGRAVELSFCFCNLDGGRLDAIAVQDTREVDSKGKEDGTSRVGWVDDTPVAQHRSRRDLAPRKRQHHQVVAGKEFTARDHQHDEAETER